MRAILVLLLFAVLVGCASAPSSRGMPGARLYSIDEALKAYHTDLHDYPARLSELRPRYLSTYVPLHDETYPESLRPLWVHYEHLDLPAVPVYQRIAKDCYLLYQRIDRDNYSLRVIMNGRFVEVECN